MFDFVRKHNKIMMVLLFLFTIPGFLLIGVERYFQGDQKGESVARVDGEDITRPEWDAQHRNMVDRIRQQQPDTDASQFDTDAARYGTLERMVRERVLAAIAAKDKLTITDNHLARIFAGAPELAQFRTSDGKFDRELFRQVTQQTPEQYEAGLRNQLAMQQVLAGVTNSAFATRAQADMVFNAFYDRREVQVAHFDAAQYTAQVKINDADIETYYKEHTAQFQAPEQASIEYLVLDLDAAKKRVMVNEDDLKKYYEDNKTRLGSKEERKVSQILIAAAADAPAAEREKAKAKAEELLAQLRKAPDSFAELARKNSQDPLSASKGGSMDFLAHGGAAGGEAFDKAMFALKKDEISGVIETPFGYHIIRLDEIKPSVVPSFEQVKANIEAEYRTQQAPKQFSDMASEFTDTVYQQADSLKPAAEKLGLTIQSATGVMRTPVAGAKGILGNRNFLNALFAADSLDRKHNTEAIDIGPNQQASGRIVSYSPARTLPLEEVKDRLRQILTTERAAQLARQDGEAKRKAWEADAKDANLGKTMLVSRTDPQAQPAAVVEAALRADASKLPAWIGVDLGTQGYAVVRVGKDVPREKPANDDVAAQEVARIAQATASAEEAAYYQFLKDRLKVKIEVPAPSDLSLR